MRPFEDEQLHYVEPLRSFVARKYLMPLVSFSTVAGVLLVDLTYVISSTPPSAALIAANVAMFSLTAIALFVFRDSLRARRCRMTSNDLVLPSVASVGDSEILEVRFDEIGQLETRRRRRNAEGHYVGPPTEVELVVRHKGADVALVWPVSLFGKRNLNAVKQRLSIIAATAGRSQ